MWHEIEIGIAIALMATTVGVPSRVEAQGVESLPPGASSSPVPGRSDGPSPRDPLKPEKLGPHVRGAIHATPWLGLQIAESTARGGDESAPPGVRIAHIFENSPAARADLQVRDRILAIAGTEISTSRELQEVVERHEPGDQMTLHIERGEVRHTVSIILSARPERTSLIRTRWVGARLPEIALRPIAPNDADELDASPETSEDAKLRDLSEWRGTPVVMEFWATWCAPCRQLESTMHDLKRQYRDRLTLLAVSAESSETLQRYRREHGPLPYTVLQDRDRRLHDRFFVSSYPMIVVADASGEITHVLFGLEARDRLESIVESLIEGASDDPSSPSHPEDS